jgi:uncharacterized protein
MSTPMKCPICGQATDFFTDPLGPFCSARCKQIDLGHWLNGDYRISEPLKPEDLEGYEQMRGPALDLPEED